LSRVLGNGHALVLRGARHSNVPGLPDRSGSLEHPESAIVSYRIDGEAPSRQGACLHSASVTAHGPRPMDCRSPIADRKGRDRPLRELWISSNPEAGGGPNSVPAFMAEQQRAR
jgi:hypothetical protein